MVATAGNFSVVDLAHVIQDCVTLPEFPVDDQLTGQILDGRIILCSKSSSQNCYELYPEASDWENSTGLLSERYIIYALYNLFIIFSIGMFQFRSDFLTVKINETHMWALGGLNSGEGFIVETEVYSALDKSWSQSPVELPARFTLDSFCAAQIDERSSFVAGLDSTLFLQRTFVYDWINDTWTEGNSLSCLGTLK